MGFKKIIKKIIQKKQPKYMDLGNKIQKDIGLKDLKHDLENQLIKISQRLENLRTKIVSTEPKSLQTQYKELCVNHKDDVSNAMVFVDRIVYQMFCELACVTILDWKSDKIDDYKHKHKHKVHKIILRVLLLYSEELSKNGIYYDLWDSDIEWHISEYVFSAIILKIVQNCTKYCKPNSTLKINIEDSVIKFTMKSLKVDSSEKIKIFENGYSWKHSWKLWKSSNWKGLFHAMELAKFHTLELWFNQIWTCIEDVNWIKYVDNEFFLKNNN